MAAGYRRRWNFGLGTILSLIIVYFIYLYSTDKGWGLLAFFSKWYLIISLGIMGIFVAIIALSLLVILLGFVFAYVNSRKLRKKEKNYIDADYEIKEE